MSTILVTGATGTVGAHLVRELRGRDARVRAFTRDANRVPAGVEAAVGDLADPASVRAALAGADRAFLCAPNHPDQLAHETTVIDAAADLGVPLVKIGANGEAIGSPVPFWDVHARIAEHLRLREVPATVLSPYTYVSNLLAAAPAVAGMDAIVAPAGDAKIAFVDPRDVAAVAAVALTEDGHAGRTYHLSGPAAVTHDEVAAALSAVLGRTISYVAVPDAAAREAMVGSGLPAWLADGIVAVYGELRRGVASSPTDVVRVLTGRDPRGIDAFLRDHAGAFRG